MWSANIESINRSGFTLSVVVVFTKDARTLRKTYSISGGAPAAEHLKRQLRNEARALDRIDAMEAELAVGPVDLTEPVEDTITPIATDAEIEAAIAALHDFRSLTISHRDGFSIADALIVVADGLEEARFMVTLDRGALVVERIRS